MAKSKPPHQVLGVKPDATLVEIKDAFRAKVLKAHPDKAGGTNEAFHELQDAYKALTGQKRKAEAEQATTVNKRARPTPDVAAVFNHYCTKVIQDTFSQRDAEDILKLSYSTDFYFSLTIAAINAQNLPVVYVLLVNNQAVAHSMDVITGKTALHFAVETGNPAIVQTVINQRHPVNKQDRNGDNALTLACRHGQGAIAKMLLNAKSDTSKITFPLAVNGSLFDLASTLPYCQPPVYSHGYQQQLNNYLVYQNHKLTQTVQHHEMTIQRLENDVHFLQEELKRKKDNQWVETVFTSDSSPRPQSPEGKSWQEKTTTSTTSDQSAKR